MIQVVLIHGNAQVRPKLAAAVPGARVAVVYLPGSTPAYNEVTGLAHQYPTLRGMLAKYAPSWHPGEPLVVLGFSAGAWALRYYLRSPQARRDINAAVFLDGLYGAPGGVCDLSPYQGVITYAKEAHASPQTKRLVMTYSLAHPDPGVCSKAIAKAAGYGAGVYVVGVNNGDHHAQQMVVGPDVLKDFVTPWLPKDGILSKPWKVAALGAAIAGAVWWITRRGVSSL